MPQRVHYSHPIDFKFVPDAVLERPILAAHITLISALWNEIEARVSAFLAAIVGHESKTVVSVYLAIQNDGAKRAALEVIVREKIPLSDADRFFEIMKAIGRRYADRNLVVHGSWGTSSKYADHLLWSDVRDSTMLHIDLMRMPHTQKQKRRARILETQKKLMVYRQKDFEQIEARLRVAYEKLYEFTRPYLRIAFGPPSTVL